ncbi:hypothetical protein BLNAU_20184 [Blattamonas nauphoetae]|uniref:Uncharacterized protein n=1 Tax=Blattamonas nauphoetae TaxID=2049346 RepID=A0ABQ9WZG3_9EUKA|nr:hypothetical protein BLNAU_20184 [Blattamonas nauphoetae]
MPEMKVKVFRRNNVPSSELAEEQTLNHLISSSEWNPSNISSLLEVLQCDDEDILVDTLRTLQKVTSESGSNDSGPVAIRTHSCMTDTPVANSISHFVQNGARPVCTGEKNQ